MKKSENICLDQTLRYFSYIYDDMTAKQKRIAHVFIDLEYRRRTDPKFSKIFYSRALIATCAKVSIECVKDFLEKYENGIYKGFVISHTKKPPIHQGRFSTNLYTINPIFFELVYLIKYLRLDLCWKKCRQDVLQGLGEDNLYLAKRMHKKGYLSTTKIPTVPPLKTPTILSLLHSQHSDYSTYLKTSAAAAVEKQDRGHQILMQMPLSFGQRKWLSLNRSPKSLMETVIAYEIASKKDRIRNIGGFFCTISDRYQRGMHNYYRPKGENNV